MLRRIYWKSLTKGVLVYFLGQSVFVFMIAAIMQTLAELIDLDPLNILKYEDIISLVISLGFVTLSGYLVAKWSLKERLLNAIALGFALFVFHASFTFIDVLDKNYSHIWFDFVYDFLLILFAYFGGELYKLRKQHNSGDFD